MNFFKSCTFCSLIRALADHVAGLCIFSVAIFLTACDPVQHFTLAGQLATKACSARSSLDVAYGQYDTQNAFREWPELSIKIKQSLNECEASIKRAMAETMTCVSGIAVDSECITRKNGELIELCHESQGCLNGVHFFTVFSKNLNSTLISDFNEAAGKIKNNEQGQYLNGFYGF